MSSQVNVIIKALDQFTKPFKGISGQLKEFKKSAMFGPVNASLNQSFKSMKNVGDEAGLLAARLGGAALAGGFLFKKFFLDTAVEFERFRTILETIEGSSEKAQKSLDWVSDFAAKTPYELGEVTDAFVKLRAYGMDPTKGLLRSLGDTSAAMGKPLMMAVEAIADAVTGENERLKEFGIKASTQGKKITYEYTENGKTMRKSVEKSNRAMIQSTLMAIFNSKYQGAMDKQSKTFAGLMSNLSDQWTRFSNLVMGAGVFDFLKDEVAGILDKVDKMAKSGELKNIANKVGKELKIAFLEIADAAPKVWDAIKQIGKAINDFANMVGGYGNLAKLAFFASLIPLAASVLQLGLSFIQVALAIAPFLLKLPIVQNALWAMLGAVINLGTGITGTLIPGLVAAASAAWAFIAPFIPAIIAVGALTYLGYKIYKSWDPNKTLFENLSKGITAFSNDVIEAINWISRLIGLGNLLEKTYNGLEVVKTETKNGSVYKTWSTGAVTREPINKNTGIKSNTGLPASMKPKKDKLEVALKVDVNGGKPRIDSVKNFGDSEMNFLANMGFMNP